MLNITMLCMRILFAYVITYVTYVNFVIEATGPGNIYILGNFPSKLGFDEVVYLFGRGELITKCTTLI